MADRGVVLTGFSESEVETAMGDIQNPPPQDTAPVQNGSLVNVPLTDAQKLLLRSYQNKLNLLAKQKSEIDVQVARVEGAMQLDMMKIARENNIDPTKFGFNDNLEISPSQPQGMPRRA
jgi:hypothetical protein